jgi:hypothetical protein
MMINQKNPEQYTILLKFSYFEWILTGIYRGFASNLKYFAFGAIFLISTYRIFSTINQGEVFERLIQQIKGF